MLESRASYGYYGEHGGATGETPPKTHKRGWRFREYTFQTTEPEWKVNKIVFKASDYEHALRQAKAYARKNGCEIVGLIDAE